MACEPGPCPICSNATTYSLVALAPPTMLSDGQASSSPLDWAMCDACGSAFRHNMPTPQQISAVFNEDYVLYDHAPEHTFERQRQAAYAEWLTPLIGPGHSALFEAGCGNGSLLLEIGARRPTLSLQGLEPANGAAEHGRRAGVDIITGFLHDHAEKIAKADIRLAVNVIEHVPDPKEFLADLSRDLPDKGRVIAVCPDGSRVADDLLVADHLYAFTGTGLSILAAEVGLEVEQMIPAPPAIGSFHAAVLGTASSFSSIPAPPYEKQPDLDGLRRARNSFLTSWKHLDAALIAALNRHGARDVSCFGAGETANQLRIYAPTFWRRVNRCVVDGSPPTSTVAGVPVVPFRAEELAGPEKLMVIATKSSSQTIIANRLAKQNITVIPLDRYLEVARGDIHA